MDRNEAISKLAGLIKDTRVAMLATVDADGTLRSRPMVAQQVEFDGTLWFFTSLRSPKSQEIERNRQVNLSYANPDKDQYVSISGTAQIVRERQKIVDLWSLGVQSWFPKGPEDPDVALIRVEVGKAEYWDAASGSMVYLDGLANR